jgi:hypothetical protein
MYKYCKGLTFRMDLINKYAGCCKLFIYGFVGLKDYFLVQKRD